MTELSIARRANKSAARLYIPNGVGIHNAPNVNTGIFNWRDRAADKAADEERIIRLSARLRNWPSVIWRSVGTAWFINCKLHGDPGRRKNVVFSYFVTTRRKPDKIL